MIALQVKVEPRYISNSQRKRKSSVVQDNWVSIKLQMWSDTDSTCSYLQSFQSCFKSCHSARRLWTHLFTYFYKISNISLLLELRNIIFFYHLYCEYFFFSHSCVNCKAIPIKCFISHRPLSGESVSVSRLKIKI